MSLNWQFTDKARFALLTEQEKNINHCFVWGCMIIDLGSITEKNAQEWHQRYVIANSKVGPFYYMTNKKPWVPTLEDVKKRIGRQTNVATKTRKQFINKLARQIANELVRS